MTVKHKLNNDVMYKMNLTKKTCHETNLFEANKNDFYLRERM